MTTEGDDIVMSDASAAEVSNVAEDSTDLVKSLVKSPDVHDLPSGSQNPIIKYKKSTARTIVKSKSRKDVTGNY